MVGRMWPRCVPQFGRSLQDEVADPSLRLTVPATGDSVDPSVRSSPDITG